MPENIISEVVLKFKEGTPAFFFEKIICELRMLIFHTGINLRVTAP